MPYVACPSCGERGKIPPTLVGARIKCKKCGIAFNVAPPTAKAAAPAAGTGGTAVAVAAADTAVASSKGSPSRDSTISWAVAHDTSDSLKPPSEQEVAAHEIAETGAKFVARKARASRSTSS